MELTLRDSKFGNRRDFITPSDGRYNLPLELAAQVLDPAQFHRLSVDGGSAHLSPGLELGYAGLTADHLSAAEKIGTPLGHQVVEGGKHGRITGQGRVLRFDEIGADSLSNPRACETLPSPWLVPR